MSYQRSSPLGATSSGGQPRDTSPGGNTVVVIKKGAAATPRQLSAGTVVRSYVGSTHTVDVGAAVNYGSDSRTNDTRFDPAIRGDSGQALLEQQAAEAEAAAVDSRKKYLTIGAVAVAGVAVLLILRKKKGPTTP